ncbi:MAG: hypothetical protein ABSB81_07250 [Halobacteriota archaeon]
MFEYNSFAMWIKRAKIPVYADNVTCYVRTSQEVCRATCRCHSKGSIKATTGSGAMGSGIGLGVVDYKTQFLRRRPLLGRLVRPRLNGEYVRDEALQARELIETLGILDAIGVDGAFVFTFISLINPYNDNPRYDLDKASTSLVKSCGGGKPGTTYPDMPWEPKESFRAVAEYYRTE